MTFPLEIELTNLPGKTDLRSVSRFGISVITVVFEDAVDIYFARQLVFERLVQRGRSFRKEPNPCLALSVPASVKSSCIWWRGHRMISGTCARSKTG